MWSRWCKGCEAHSARSAKPKLIIFFYPFHFKTLHFFSLIKSDCDLLFYITVHFGILTNLFWRCSRPWRTSWKRRIRVPSPNLEPTRQVGWWVPYPVLWILPAHYSTELHECDAGTESLVCSTRHTNLLPGGFYRNKMVVRSGGLQTKLSTSWFH